jgi:hypothetical protein
VYLSAKTMQAVGDVAEEVGGVERIGRVVPDV